MDMIGHNGAPAEINGGWIKLYRDIREHPLVGHCLPVRPCDPKRGSASRGEAWQDLIMEASYKRTRRRNKGQEVWLDVGDLMAAHSYLANRWNWTVKQVRRFLDVLEQHDMISRPEQKRASEGQAKGKQPDNQAGMQKGKQTGTASSVSKSNSIQIISICNYSRFQEYDLFMQGALAPLAGVFIDEKGQARSQPEGQPPVPTLSENGQESKNKELRNRKETARERDQFGLVPKYDDHEDVEFDGATLVLRNGVRSFWLEKFGNAEDLDLALIRAAGYIQANSSRPIRVQVESQLAKQAQEKRDKDQRYAKAVDRGKRQPGKGATPRSFDDALAESIAAKSGGMPT